LTDSKSYRGKFSRIYWVSPTARVDGGLDQLRDYVKNHTDQNQDEDPTFHETIDVAFLQSRVDRQKKITEYLKGKKSKQKGFNICIVLDDLADVKKGLPEISRFVDSLFVKARHWGVSVVLSTQKLKLSLSSPCVRVNATCLLAWRLRNQSDLLEGLVYEYSALVSKEKLYEAYKQAVAIPYNFLYVNLLAKDVDNMFYSGFSKKFQMTDTTDEDSGDRMSTEQFQGIEGRSRGPGVV
jgi:hypothetical protein